MQIRFKEFRHWKTQLHHSNDLSYAKKYDYVDISLTGFYSKFQLLLPEILHSDERLKVNCVYKMQLISVDESLKSQWDITQENKTRNEEESIKINEWNKIHTKQQTNMLHLSNNSFLLKQSALEYFTTEEGKHYLLAFSLFVILLTNLKIVYLS